MKDTYDPSYDPFASEKYGAALRERWARNLKYAYRDPADVRFVRVFAERSRQHMVRRDRAEEIARIAQQCTDLLDGLVDGIEDAAVIRRAVVDKLSGWRP